MLSLWQMSLSAGAVILVTALLRRMAGARLPRRMYIALWDVALLCGLIPFRVTWGAFARRATASVSTVSSALPDIPLQAPALHNGMPEAAAITAVPVTTPPAVSGLQNSLAQVAEAAHEVVQSAPGWLWQALGIFWGVGAIALAAVLLTRWLSCRRAFAEALPCVEPRVAAFLQAYPLRRRVRVRVSGCVASPLSYGLLRPVILLPVSLTGADDQTLTYVLTHEHMHIRAWDMLRKSVLLLALCLHWPNPLFWLAARLCNRDMELMCDERVVRRLGGRKAYCLTLLDMEVQRSSLTMGTCFSVTGIEERIKVMKNRKHQGILSITLAFTIFLGAAVGAVTGIPLATAENTPPRIFFSRETWENNYAKYEPFGLTYDEENGTISYKGQIVRYFEDMWPVDEQGKAGTCFMCEGGIIDVYGVREFSETIQRNPDGSFDPSGTLVGLREATPEESAELTARMKGDFLTQGYVTEWVDAYQFQNAETVSSGALLAATTALSDIEWWTAAEYREWLDNERLDLQKLVDEQARAWTPSQGWFTWTQELADEAIARYEEVLRSIEQGASVSKTINGEEANMTLMQNVDTVFLGKAGSQSVWSLASDIPPVESASDDAIVEDQAVSVAFTSTLKDTATLQVEPDTGSDMIGKVVLVAVSPDDEWRYTPEQRAKIHELIELGVIQWQEPSTQEELNTAMLSYQEMRVEEWRRTIAPYAPFGLSYALDTATDLVHLYWNGQEVRGIFDPERGMWITEHSGNGFPDGAKELIAVYENGVLTGLREADAEESEFWDKTRNKNSQR